MNKRIKITTYWDPQSAVKLGEEAIRTGVAAASLIRFHTLRSLNNPSGNDLAGSTHGRNVRHRLGVENR